MARGKKHVGPKKQAKTTFEQPADWLDSVSMDEPVSWTSIRHLYGLVSPCRTVEALHGTTGCASNPLCVKGLRVAKGMNAVVKELVGEQPPEPLKEAISLPKGLKNLGNTCYFNAVLQILFSFPNVRCSVMQAGGKERKDSVLQELQLIFGEMEMTNLGFVNPRNLVRLLEIDVDVQQDAQEFLSLFLTVLLERRDIPVVVREALKKEFEGHLLCTKRCRACGNRTLKAEPFLCLTLPVGSLLSKLDERMREATEIADFVCEKCGETGVASSTEEFKILPELMVFHFLRFQYDPKSNCRTKILSSASIPQELDLSHHTGAEKGTEVFELAAVVNHLGNDPTQGHYTAAWRETKVAHDDALHLTPGSWFHADDEIVKDASRKYLVDEISSKDAYMVVYRRKVRCGVREEVCRLCRSRSSDETDDEEDRLSFLPQDGSALEPSESLSFLTTFCSVKNAEHREAAETFVKLKADVRERAECWGHTCEEVFGRAAAPNTKTDPVSGCTYYAIPASYCVYLGVGGPLRADGVQRAIEASQETGKDIRTELEGTPAVSCRSLACAHGCLDFKSAFKIVSSAAWDAIVSAYGCSDMSFPLYSEGSDSVFCVKCCQEEIRSLLVTRSNETLDTQMKTLAAVEVKKDGIFVNPSVLELWRNSAFPMGPLAERKDLSSNLACPHGNIAPNVPKTAIHPEVVVYLLSSVSNNFCLENEFRQGPSDSDAADLLCDKCIKAGNAVIMDHLTLRSRRIEENRCFAQVLLQPPMQRNSKVFSKNLATATRQFRKNWAKEQAANAGGDTEEKQRRNTACKSASNEKEGEQGQGDTASEVPQRINRIPLIDLQWVDRWSSWVKLIPDDPTPPPQGPISTSVKCPHGGLILTLEDLNPQRLAPHVRKGGPRMVAVEDPAVYERLVLQYGVEGETFLVETDEDRSLDPAPCSSCVNARREAEHKQLFFYELGTVTLEGEVKISKKHRERLSFVLDVSCETTIVDIKQRAAGWFLETKQRIFEPDDLIFEGNTLLDDTNLAFNTVPNGGCLTLTSKGPAFRIEESKSKPKASERETAPEVGFSGSVLTSVDASSPTGSSKIKECPVCTFHNPDIRSICEMCESPLL